MRTNFGTARPGSEPPPRQPLTPDQIKYRETFTRAGHLAGEAAQSQANPASGAPNPAAPESSAKVFDEQAIRSALRQDGMDFAFQIFPIGEKPPQGAPGSSQHRENRLEELESERGVMRQRMLTAESAAAGAIRELGELQVRFDTLTAELETLKAAKAKKGTT